MAQNNTKWFELGFNWRTYLKLTLVFFVLCFGFFIWSGYHLDVYFPTLNRLLPQKIRDNFSYSQIETTRFGVLKIHKPVLNLQAIIYNKFTENCISPLTPSYAEIHVNLWSLLKLKPKLGLLSADTIRTQLNTINPECLALDGIVHPGFLTRFLEDVPIEIPQFRFEFPEGDWLTINDLKGIIKIEDSRFALDITGDLWSQSGKVRIHSPQILAQVAMGHQQKKTRLSSIAADTTEIYLHKSNRDFESVESFRKGIRDIVQNPLLSFLYEVNVKSNYLSVLQHKAKIIEVDSAEIFLTEMQSPEGLETGNSKLHLKFNEIKKELETSQLKLKGGDVELVLSMVDPVFNKFTLQKVFLKNRSINQQTEGLLSDKVWISHNDFLTNAYKNRELKMLDRVLIEVKQVEIDWVDSKLGQSILLDDIKATPMYQDNILEFNLTCNAISITDSTFLNRALKPLIDQKTKHQLSGNHILELISKHPINDVSIKGTLSGSTSDFYITSASVFREASLNSQITFVYEKQKNQKIRKLNFPEQEWLAIFRLNNFSLAKNIAPILAVEDSRLSLGGMLSGEFTFNGKLRDLPSLKNFKGSGTLTINSFRISGLAIQQQQFMKERAPVFTQELKFPLLRMEGLSLTDSKLRWKAFYGNGPLFDFNSWGSASWGGSFYANVDATISESVVNQLPAMTRNGLKKGVDGKRTTSFVLYGNPKKQEIEGKGRLMTRAVINNFKNLFGFD
jgi:hypothetical protein